MVDVIKATGIEYIASNPAPVFAACRSPSSTTAAIRSRSF
jgi:hypothetical protein